MSPDWQPDPDETPGDLEHVQDAAQGAWESRVDLWPRVSKTYGALYSPKPLRAAKRRKCDGHLVEPHWIEVGDAIVWCALPPENPEIGNTGWWHAAFCEKCAPIDCVDAGWAA